MYEHGSVDSPIYKRAYIVAVIWTKNEFEIVPGHTILVYMEKVLISSQGLHERLRPACEMDWRSIRWISTV